MSDKEIKDILTQVHVDEIARQCGEMLNEGTINLIQSEMFVDLLTSHDNLLQLIDSQAKEIEKRHMIHEDYRRTALERIAYQESVIERLRNMVEVVLYHHPIVDDPIDYESAYDDLKSEVKTEYEKNPWIIPAGGEN